MRLKERIDNYIKAEELTDEELADKEFVSDKLLIWIDVGLIDEKDYANAKEILGL